MTGSRSSWGSVRKLPSGRWQARHRVGRVWRNAPTTYTTKRDAESYLAATRAALERGSWIDPQRGTITLREYATAWLAAKVSLRPRSKEQYEINLRLHILPELGEVRLIALTPSAIREWNATLVVERQLGAQTVAKCYRLLHAILATAVEDEVLTRNPCVLRGLATARSPERPIATIEQVYALANAIDPSLRMMVLLATFTGMRLGELRGLRRRNIDLERRVVRVVEQLQELASGELVLGPPKTDAGTRSVSIPDALTSGLRVHLDCFSGAGPDGWVFCGTLGQPLHRKTFYRHWRRAVAEVDLPGFRFHDLRHTGNTMAARTGASTKELMARMGHSSSRAALIYQHSSPERDERIADALSEQIRMHTQD